MPGQATEFATSFLKTHPELSELMSVYSFLSMLVSSALIRFILKVIEYFSVFPKIRKMQDFIKQNLDICDLLDKVHLRSEARQLRYLVRPDVANLVTLMSKWDAGRKPKDNAFLRWLVVGLPNQKRRLVACRIILLLICSCLTSLLVFWCIQHGSFRDITSRVGVLVLIVWAVGFLVGFVLISKAVEKYPDRPIGFIDLGFAIFSALSGGVAGLSLLVFFYSIWKII